MNDEKSENVGTPDLEAENMMVTGLILTVGLCVQSFVIKVERLVGKSDLSESVIRSQYRKERNIRFYCKLGSMKFVLIS